MNMLGYVNCKPEVLREHDNFTKFDGLTALSLFMNECLIQQLTMSQTTSLFSGGRRQYIVNFLLNGEQFGIRV